MLRIFNIEEQRNQTNTAVKMVLDATKGRLGTQKLTRAEHRRRSETRCVKACMTISSAGF